ncbi:MAG TPA: hypothetical protein VHE14_07675 [Solirubrobacteraceae bacterium]|nr:hypothetical protein [Solirubrobacteraceae bacterium]
MAIRRSLRQRLSSAGGRAGAGAGDTTEAASSPARIDSSLPAHARAGSSAVPTVAARATDPEVFRFDWDQVRPAQMLSSDNAAAGAKPAPTARAPRSRRRLLASVAGAVLVLIVAVVAILLFALPHIT